MLLCTQLPLRAQSSRKQKEGWPRAEHIEQNAAAPQAHAVFTLAATAKPSVPKALEV